MLWLPAPDLRYLQHELRTSGMTCLPYRHKISASNEMAWRPSSVSSWLFIVELLHSCQMCCSRLAQICCTEVETTAFDALALDDCRHMKSLSMSLQQTFPRSLGINSVMVWRSHFTVVVASYILFQSYHIFSNAPCAYTQTKLPSCGTWSMHIAHLSVTDLDT